VVPLVQHRRWCVGGGAGGSGRWCGWWAGGRAQSLAPDGATAGAGGSVARPGLGNRLGGAGLDGVGKWAAAGKPSAGGGIGSSGWKSRGSKLDVGSGRIPAPTAWAVARPELAVGAAGFLRGGFVGLELPVKHGLGGELPYGQILSRSRGIVPAPGGASPLLLLEELVVPAQPDAGG